MKMTETESLPKYIENHLFKKEGDEKWIEYWIIIRGKYLLLYKHRPRIEEYKEAFKGYIELTENTKCIAAKRKKYSFPFYIVTQKARYLFKTQSTLSRHQWFTAVDLASKGKPPQTLPLTLSLPSQENDETFSQSGNLEDIQLIQQPVRKEIEPVSEEEEDADRMETSTNLIVVANSKGGQISRFLERKTPIEDGDMISLADDVKVTDLEEKTPEEIDQRLHEIYCGDKKVPNTANPYHPISYLYQKPIQSFGYPSISRASLLKSSSSNISRLIKSAETLRDIQPDSHQLTSSSLQPGYNRGGSLLKKLGPIQNKAITKSRFSRHLVNSAPDVKTCYTKDPTLS